MPVIPSYSGVGHREGTRDLERAARLPGDWNVWHPTYLSGQHEGPILIPFQLFLFQHGSQNIRRVKRQAPGQVCSVPGEVLRPQDGWLGVV